MENAERQNEASNKEETVKQEKEEGGMIWWGILIVLFLLQASAFKGFWEFAQLVPKFNGPEVPGTLIVAMANPIVVFIALGIGIFLFVQTIIRKGRWSTCYIVYSLVLVSSAVGLCGSWVISIQSSI
jgi:hypothetical protein